MRRTLQLRCAVAAGAALTVGALFALPQQSSSAADLGTAAAASPIAGLLHPHPGQVPASSATSSSADPGQATGSAGDAPLDGSGLDVRSVVDTAAASSLGSSGIPQVALDAYRRAAGAAPSSCGISWSLLAAIGRVESNHGRFAGAVLHADGLSTPPVLGPVLDGVATALVPDTDGGRLDGDPVHDRAVGPMQFIPSTWARYAADGNGDGVRDPFNVYDAAKAAAAYLCTAGGDLLSSAGQARAVFAYNHSDTYVSTVLALAAFYAGTAVPELPAAPLPEPALEPVNPAPPPALQEAPLAAAAPLAAPVPAAPGTTTPPGSSTGDPSAPGTTPPVTSTPAPTTPPVGSTTPPTTTPPGTTPPTTTPPSTTPPTTTPPTTTPSCPVVPAGLVVDVVDDAGQAAADRVRADLRAGGVTLGTLTTGTARVPTAIEYPVAARTDATTFADALGAARYLRQAASRTHVTLVIGPGQDAAGLLTALDRFTACSTTSSATSAAPAG